MRGWMMMLALGMVLPGMGWGAESGEKPGDSETGARPEPLSLSVRDSFFAGRPGPHVLALKDWYVWGLTAFRWTDGNVHAYYARWPRRKGFAAWMTDSEIAHAVADTPEGPFVTTGTVIASRHKKGWDILTAHNPSVCVANGKIYLYYISLNLRGRFEKASPGPFPSREWLRAHRLSIVRNTQCIGLAVAESPEGPFDRTPTPVVTPVPGLFKNIANNPAVVYRDGTFLMILKGDALDKKKWYRIQIVGRSSRAEGPFVFEKQPIFDRAQTEDACLWYDTTAKRYNCVIHVIGQPVLAHLVSEDGIRWREAKPFTFMRKQFRMSDGSIWKPGRVERPFVLTDARGRADWIYTAVFDRGRSGNIAVRLLRE